MRCFYLIFCLFFIQGPSFSQSLLPEVQKIVYLDAEMDFRNTPGFLFGIITPDTLEIFSFGVGSLEDSLPIQPEAIFELGELTQVFTATLTQQMESRGLINLDSTLSGYLDALPPDCPCGLLTLRQLLQHCSGLPRFPPNFGDEEAFPENPYAHFTQSDLLNFCLQWAGPENLPSGYAFSNLNYALLGLALEKAAGQPYSQLVSPILPIPSQQPVPGYRGGTLDPAIPWETGAMKPAIGLRASMGDLLTFLNELSIMPQMLDESIPTQIRDNTRMGFGWHVIYPRKKIAVLAHTGATGGHRAYMAFVPATRTGVVSLSNSPYGLQGAEMLILRMLNKNWK